MSSSSTNFKEIHYHVCTSLHLPAPFRQEIQLYFKECLPSTPSFTTLETQPIATLLHLAMTFEELPIDASLHCPALYRQDLQLCFKECSPLTPSSKTLETQFIATHPSLIMTFKEIPIDASLCLLAPYRQELQLYFKECLPLTPSFTNSQTQPTATYS